MSANRETTAPTGRKKIAQGQERSGDALGHESQNMAGTDGAKVNAARGFDLQGNALPESEITENELPPGWRWVRVREVGNVQLGRQRAPKHQNGANMRPYLRVANVFEDRLDLSDVLTMNFTPREFETFALRANDILLNEGQSLHLVGRPALYRDELPGVCFQNTLIRFRPGPDVEPKFALTIFRGYMHTGKFQKIARWTTNIAHLGAQRFAEMPFPLPPLAEQRRIVAEIEKQFTRLEAGVAALQRVQGNLKRYRAAVLKAACEGRLVPTEVELRKDEGRRRKDENKRPRSAASSSSFLLHNSSFESGSDLLARILTERRQNWQGRGQYKEPAEPDTTNLPRPPEGWGIISLDQLSAIITSGSRDWSQYYGRGTGTFVMAQNVRPGKLDLSYKLPVDPPLDNRDRVRSEVAIHDLLVTIVGANTGDVCRVPVQLPEHYVCQSVALMRLVVPDVSKYVELYLASPENGRKQFDRYIYGAGRPHLSFDQIKMTAIALPPLAEQTRIVAEVERRLSVVEELEAVVSANLQRATRLRQAILQKAFTGELVRRGGGDG